MLNNMSILTYNPDVLQWWPAKKWDTQFSHELLLPLNMGKETQYANPDSWNKCLKFHNTTDNFQYSTL